MRRLLSGLIAMMISAVSLGLTAETVHAGTLTAPDSIDNAHQSVGLVLSGGGAKGIAHIGVIQALEDNNIPIDFVTGTSMGAIVGGLYAAGYTPQEMLDLILSRGFSYWSTGKTDPRLTYYFSNEPPTPAMLTVPIARKDSASNASAVPASLINPMPMSFAFMELFAPYTAQCGSDFNKLFVPFRCVASDPAAKRKVVFAKGDLGDAVRASMSFPLIFQPIYVDSALLYDGGIYDNFPVDVMERDFAPSIMLGIDVSTQSSGPQTSLMDQIENLVIQNNDYNLPPKRGIKLHIDLNEFSLLDFPKAKQIYDIGYNHAMAIMDSIKTRVTTRVPAEARELRRAVFKSGTPFMRFDSVTVTGASPRQNNFIRYIFDPTPSDTFGITEARRAFYRAISPGLLRDLFPQAAYNRSTGLFSLNLKASVKNNFKVGFGGYLTSSTNSYIFVNAGYSTLSFNSISTNINAWIGQSYMAGSFNARMAIRTPTPTAISVEGVASRSKFYENDYLFYEDKMPTFILNHEYFVRLKYSIAAGSRAKVDAGAGYGHLYDSFYRSNNVTSYEAGRDKAKYNLGAAFARFTSNTLSSENYPVSGASYDISAMAITGNFHLHPSDPAFGALSSKPKWLQFESRTRNYFTIGRKFALGIESDIMLSTRKLLPDYNSAIIFAPAYRPTPASYNAFNPGLRANSFVAAGIVPVVNIAQNLSARLGLHGFLPLRKIEETPGSVAPHYGRWFHDPEFFGELDLTYNFPFASLTGYCNYSTSPTSTWNLGISFGVFILAPKFLR